MRHIAMKIWATLTAIGTICGMWLSYYLRGKPTSTVPPQAPKLPPDATLPPKPAPMPTPKPHTLSTFCDGIEEMEGANPANNNPGNCRCSPVGYASMYGHVTCNAHKFAVFPTKALGRTYLENLVHHRVMLHPTWDFFDFFTGIKQPDGTYVGGYAPSGDQNDPHHYAIWMAAYCKVSPDTKLAKLLA